MHEYDSVYHNMSKAVCLAFSNSLIRLHFCFTHVSHSLRYRRCGSYHDSRAQRTWDHGPAGEENHCGDVHQHRDTEPAEVRQPHISCVRLHLLHRSHDPLSGLAGLLLHPEVLLRQRKRSQPGTVTLTNTELETELNIKAISDQNKCTLLI